MVSLYHRTRTTHGQKRAKNRRLFSDSRGILQQKQSEALVCNQGVASSNLAAGTNDFNKLDESYKLTIWDNVPDAACFERLAVLLTRHAHDQRITSITPAHLPRCVQSAPCNAPGFRFWSNAVR